MRLSQIVQNPNGTSHDLTLGYGYNPASQIVQTTRSNDAYAWGGHYQVNRSYDANGLNQYTAVGSAAPTYDANGNLTSAGGAAYYVYDSTNRLYAMDNGVLGYDPAGRLFAIGTTAGHTYLLNSGDEMIGEYSSTGAILRRYVHGPGIDEPLVWYEGSGTSDRRWLHADERGSVIAISNSSGNVTNVNAYDEYGIPASANVGRFQYTGLQWLAEIGMQYSRNRIYNPGLGRFMQTDPIGYWGGMNLYGYVLNDPVNFTDPLGLSYEDIFCGAIRTCLHLDGGDQNPVVIGDRCRVFDCNPSRDTDRIWRTGALVAPIGTSTGERGAVPPCNPATDSSCVVVTGRRNPQPPPRRPLPLLPASTPFVSIQSNRERDYCGGGGQTWPPDRLGGVDISGACARHDACYGSSVDRLACDRRLRDDILRRCQIYNIICVNGAQIYYWSVRAGGEEHYRRAGGTGNPD